MYRTSNIEVGHENGDLFGEQPILIDYELGWHIMKGVLDPHAGI